MNRPRVFLDSCVLIEGLVAPWSASRGVLILGRAALFRFVLAEIVIEETERALAGKLGDAYGGRERLRADFRLLLNRLKPQWDQGLDHLDPSVQTHQGVRRSAKFNYGLPSTTTTG